MWTGWERVQIGSMRVQGVFVENRHFRNDHPYSLREGGVYFLFFS